MTMSTGNRLVIFDFDETLAVNQPKYDAAKDAVASYVFDTMQPDRYDEPDDIVNEVLDAEDAARYRATGIPETRFRDSCVHTVYEVAKQVNDDENRSVDTATVEQAVKFAEVQGLKPMFDYTEDDLLPGAREALEHVEEQGDDNVIMTKGSRDAQQVKLDATGLTDYTAHIVDEKETAAFDAAVNVYDPDSVWMVGNSVRSDAHPMLDYGGNVLLIADPDYTATWRGEDADNPLPEDGPWFRNDGLEQFVDEGYPIIEAFDETGDINILQEHR